MIVDGWIWGTRWGWDGGGRGRGTIWGKGGGSERVDSICIGIGS